MAATTRRTTGEGCFCCASHVEGVVDSTLHMQWLPNCGMLSPPAITTPDTGVTTCCCCAYYCMCRWHSWLPACSNCQRSTSCIRP